MPTPSHAGDPLEHRIRPSARADHGERDRLLAEIAEVEGEPLDEPPLIFKLVVVVGLVVAAVGVAGLALGIGRRIGWAP